MILYIPSLFPNPKERFEDFGRQGDHLVFRLQEGCFAEINPQLPELAKLNGSSTIKEIRI
jgi:hypothetical protein